MTPSPPAIPGEHFSHYPMHRVHHEPLYVLHTFPYRNTSLIIDGFTMNFGRIAVVARSARGLQSRYRGILQLFSPLLASWTGRRSLKNLSAAEQQQPTHLLEGVALLAVFYLNELLQRLLAREDPHPQIYTLYRNTLTLLETNAAAYQSTLRYFEKYLLQYLGYGLFCHNNRGSQNAILEHADYHYTPERGFFSCAKDPNNPYIFQGKTLLALLNDALDSEPMLQESERLLRLALSHYTGQKPLKSRELLVAYDA